MNIFLRFSKNTLISLGFIICSIIFGIIYMFTYKYIYWFLGGMGSSYAYDADKLLIATAQPPFIIMLALSFILNGAYFGKELLFKIGASIYIIPWIITIGFYYYYIGISEKTGIPLTQLSAIFWEYIPFDETFNGVN